ncbi:hypothetical protein GCM10009808_26740 [Microbacterium sediminicola]|uniref:Cell division initiation protein n=1 Tax=Microbacterium sediminicola TaxID=415210 RepID=A0ABN2ILG6_9MICO
MSDNQNADPFDALMQGQTEQPAASEHGAHPFTVGFRGYDRGEVDMALATLNANLQRATLDLQAVKAEQAAERERIQSEHENALAAARAEAEDAASAARADGATELEQLRADLTTTQAKLSDAEERITALSGDILEGTPDADGEGSTRQQFEAVLRVAEEQASQLIQNAAVQAERLLEASRDEIAAARTQLDMDRARIISEAESDADQARLRIETEYTAHEARIQRESAHATEKVTQAEQEAATIRTEAEKGAAALRAMVTRETTQQRADAERDVREMNARVLEFEESLTRRQDDAQQEFLALHNQAVAHAERITNDANEQVAASLEHAQRISAKAEDYEKLIRAQAGQIDADAQLRARETMSRAQAKAQKIVESVTAHTNTVLRDAEDRTRQLRWQQQQLTSFMAEVRELIRPDGPMSSDVAATASDQTPSDSPEESLPENTESTTDISPTD